MTAREQPADSAWTAPRSVVSQRRFLIFLIVVTAVFALTMSPFVRCDMVTIMNSADALAASGFSSDIVHGGLPHLVVPAGSGFISIYPKALEYAFGLLFLLLDTTSRLTIVILIVAAAAAVIWLRVAAANRLLAMTVPGIFLAVTGLILNFGDGHGGLMAAVHMAVALLCASLVYRLAETMTPRDRSPFMSIAYGLVFGSILLFAARCYYRDVYYVTAVLGAAYFTIRRNLPWLYACYFLGVAVKYEHVVIALPALALFSWLEWRAGVVAFRSVLRHGLILGGLTAAALSLHFFLLFLAVGMDPALMRAVTLRFGSSLAAPSFTTIYALLVSPGKGMLLFCPLTVLLLFVRFERIEAPREVTLLATLSLTYFLFAASLFFWSGDYAWGPRLVLLPMLLSGASWRKRRRSLGGAVSRRLRYWASWSMRRAGF